MIEVTGCSREFSVKDPRIIKMSERSNCSCVRFALLGTEYSPKAVARGSLGNPTVISASILSSLDVGLSLPMRLIGTIRVGPVLALSRIGEVGTHQT